MERKKESGICEFVKVGFSCFAITPTSCKRIGVRSYDI